MNAPTRLIARSRRGARPMPAAGHRAIERRRFAPPWPRVWLFLGLLLAGVGTPAYGFDHQSQSAQAAQHMGLDGSGVPTSANWVVLDTTGIAGWRAQGETLWNRFTRGEVLPPGCEIETGSDGEVTLVAGGDQLTIAPRGRLIVPVAQPGQDRRLRHERGRILMQIEARDARDVRVDTPLLSLGIKGTAFEVLVEPDQDSVVVHDGDVTVTTPGGVDPVDLRIDEGLRQRAVPGSEATRFDLPAPEGAASSSDGPAWRLPQAETDDPGQAEMYGPPAPPEAAETVSRTGLSRDSGARQRASSEAGFDFGQLDELASSWGNIAIAAVGLLLLTIPALVLVQHLREQWLGRPGPKGERRRQLVRG